MLILEDGSRIIDSALRDRSNAKEPLDYRFGDYGEARFHLWEEDGVLKLSMALPGYKDLAQLGLEAHLSTFFGTQAVTQTAPTEADFDVTLQVRKDDLTDELAGKLALLRRTCLALPLELAMAAQDRGGDTAMMRIALRGSDAIYVQGTADRVTVVLSTKFDDPSDIVLGRVFLQEFYEMRRQPHLQNAPAVLFGKEPPNEVRALIPSSGDPSLSYITFVLFPPHYAGAKRQKCVSMIINFRDYFHYHIKACKAYLHNRMRAKVAEFLKMLNRTKPLLGPKSP